ncbi:MAG TPA: primosomal protein N' [Anaerolineaceae bacterium]
MTAPWQFVEVAVNVPGTAGTFHYHVPSELAGQIQAGSLVTVPFGKQEVQGVVLRHIEAPEVPQTRPLRHLLDPLPVLTPVQLALAAWLAEQTLAPLSACIDLMLPPGLSQVADTLYHLNLPALPASGLSPVQKRLVDLLQRRGDLRGRQIEAALPRQNWRLAAEGMARRGWLTSRPVLPPPTVRPRVVRTVQLAVSPEVVDAYLSSQKSPASAAAQRRERILRFLVREPWQVEAAWAYAQSGGSLPDLQRLAEDGLVILAETEVLRDPLAEISAPPAEPPELLPDQVQAWRSLQTGIQSAAMQASGGHPLRPYLLHGITGSGKTEIYLRAVAETIRLGRQAIILVPEIALTPQTVRRFLGRFPGQVGLVHSQLSAGERYDTWRRARAGKLAVMIGPRSALFTPLPSLGLIVVDECHEPSYYQDDFLPAYSAVRAAEAYARLSGGIVLFGSATPDVGMFFRAHQEGWNLLSLPVRILAHRQTVQAQMQKMGLPMPALESEASASRLNLPQVSIIDMRQELKAGNRSIFSRALQEGLRRVLDAGQQAILYLNRKGTATYVFCRACGAALHCPHCDLPLAYHASIDLLVCHTCGYRRKMPARCPLCGSEQIRALGAGTEKVESEVKALFPAARTLRWDAETTRQKGAHELILAHFSSHHADILVGTQMLAKGLDLPLVTLVGAVLADVGLNLPDYRAGERAFQLLTQVAGRAGRSPLGGQAILQTFQPESYPIQAAAAQDYNAFYAQEIKARRTLGYPPFSRLVRLEYRHSSEDTARQEAESMACRIEGWLAASRVASVSLIGPVPCYFSRQNGLYRWQIVLRGVDPLAPLRGKPLGEWLVQVDPLDLL